MPETVTVLHLIAGTTTKATHHGDQITFQHFADGGALIRVYRDGRPVQTVSYRQAEVITRDRHIAAEEDR
jgi:hypothetical protein